MQPRTGSFSGFESGSQSGLSRLVEPDLVKPAVSQETHQHPQALVSMCLLQRHGHRRGRKKMEAKKKLIEDNKKKAAAKKSGGKPAAKGAKGAKTEKKGFFGFGK